MKVKQMLNDVESIEESVKLCSIADCTFSKAKLTKSQKDILESEYKYRFKLWSDTWILSKTQNLKKELGVEQ